MQYSDDAKTEFKLNTYHDKGIVLSALQGVRYRGGNTKTGTKKELSCIDAVHIRIFIGLNKPESVIASKDSEENKLLGVVLWSHADPVISFSFV